MRGFAGIYSAAVRLARRPRMDGKSVDRTGQFFRQCLVNETVTIDAAFVREPLRHYMNAKMGLSLRTMSGVTGVEMRFVDDLQFAGRERGYQFCFECVFYGHER